ncbi:MAG: hypothetical protein AB7F98_18435 [Novosphingobium sp.]
MIRGAVAMLAVLACTAATAPPRQNSCDLKAWGSKQHTVVRAAPSPNARILASLAQRKPKSAEDYVDGPSPEFHINAARSGWFRIDRAWYTGYDDPADDRELFSGQGWVRGDQIGADLIGGARLHAAPSDRARSRQIPPSAFDSGIDRLLDCNGSWAKIEASYGTGWVHGLCSNQVTTCV